MILTADDVERAYPDLDPVFRDTPQFVAPTLSHHLGAQVLAKVETLNPIRSFKGRGADLLFRNRHFDGAPVVCASAGNFGQAVAWAALRRGVTAHVFAASTANPLKVDAMRRLGANVHLDGADFDAAKHHARSYAEERGLRFIEDGREPAVAVGAGTIALEMFTSDPVPDVVLVPLGNGALLGGMATWIRAAFPRTEIIGVAAAGAPAMALSWKRGTVVNTGPVATIADGIAVRAPVPESLPPLWENVDDVVLVDDADLLSAIHLLFVHLGLVVEPAGAAGIAALIANPGRFHNRLVGVPLCGGNAAPEIVAGLLTRHGSLPAP